MPKRLKHFPLNGATALAVALTLATVFMWTQSHWEDHTFVVRNTPAGQYRLHSSDGFLTLCSPPQPTLSPLNGESEKLVEQLHNDQIKWIVGSEGVVAFIRGQPAKRLREIGSPAETFLLKAIDDPNRWIAAHVLLTASAKRIPANENMFGTANVGLNGLRVTVPLGQRIYPNPDDKEALSAHWHQQMDIEVGRVSYATFAIIFAMLPAYRLLAQYRRHRLRSQGRCIACGYDLRTTPNRCPECGLTVESPPSL